MREILFRGKTKNGEWKYGDLIIEHYGNTPYIHWFEYSSLAIDMQEKVIPETVGQFTGLTDKNGKKIFEGDIVQNGENEECYWHFRKGVVKFGEGTFDSGIYRYTGFYFEESDGTIDHNTLYKVEDVWYQVKVIGNVFDNPELLEKENV